MRHAALLTTATVWLALGCGDGGTSPRPGPGDGTRLGAQFDRLADSVDAGGYSPAGDALRHAAEIVRLTGHATPVSLTIDGAARSFLAVAEQLDFPNLVCSWPADSGIAPPPDTITVPPPDTVGVPPDGGGGTMPPDSGGVIPVDTGVVLPPPRPPECQEVGTYSMRTLIAWEPEHMAEVVRIVAYIGSNTVEPGVPDVMTGLPSTVAADPSGPPTTPPMPPDSGSGSGGGGEPGGFPGFMGEYLVRDVGSWYAVEGNQTNALEAAAGACTDDRATIDWAEFDCEAARYRFEFGMTVDPVNWERLTGATSPPTSPEGSHTLAMGSSSVDGVRLTWVAWSPPPLPPGPGPVPIPVDSTGAARPM
jgi:hypothetical protein